MVYYLEFFGDFGNIDFRYRRKHKCDQFEIDLFELLVEAQVTGQIGALSSGHFKETF